MPVHCTCQWCGNTFATKKSRIAIGKGKFCSQRCGWHAKAKQVARTCGICGKHFSVKRSVVAKPKHGRFCSHKCHSESVIIPLDDKFFLYVGKKTPAGCIEWSGYINPVCGYGYLTTCGRALRAHRVSYELMVGPITDGLFVLHHCDNRICVNPTHLFLGTQQDNMDDMHSKGRGRWGPNQPNKNPAAHTELSMRPRDQLGKWAC